MPTVSVVIPTFRHASTVVAALESVFAQTFDDYEVIVVNDGSPDDTAAVLAPYVADGRIRYLEQPNAGQGAARNRGIGLARGEFVALLDDDDQWPPDKLAWQLALLRARPDAVLAYGFARPTNGEPWRYPEPPGPDGQVRQRLLDGNFILSPGQTLVRAAAMRQVGAFDPAIWGADDWDLHIRLAAIGEFAYEERIALHYRMHATNASRNIPRMFANACRVLHKHLGRWPLPGRARAWFRCRAGLGRMAAVAELPHFYRHLAEGQRASAAASALRIVRYWPQIAFRRKLVPTSVLQMLGLRRSAADAGKDRRPRATLATPATGAESIVAASEPGRSNAKENT